jgi:GMP synthase (glutamine-hydrolysing)
MKILLVNNAEKGIDEFVRRLQHILNTAAVAADTISYLDTATVDPDKYEGVILSGSPQGDDIVDHHMPYFQWLKRFHKPVLGICAGHHIIGKLYGADLLRSVEPEDGDFTVYIDASDPLFAGFGTRFVTRQMHNDSITLPQGFVLLAHAHLCRVQAMIHREKPLYSTQFHPEYLNHPIIFNFVAICGNYRKS